MCGPRVVQFLEWNNAGPLSRLCITIGARKSMASVPASGHNLTMSDSHSHSRSQPPHGLVMLGIGALVLGYIVLCMMGWPQDMTEQVVHPAHAEHQTIAAPAMVMILPFVLLLAAIAILPLVPG